MVTNRDRLARDPSSGHLLRQALEWKLSECRSRSMCQCVPLYLCYQPPLSFVSVLCRPTVVFSSSGDRANARFYVFHAISRTLIHLSVFCACTPTCPHDPHPTRIPLNARSREAEELSRVAGDEIWKISEASMDARSRDRMMSARTGKTSGVQTSFASPPEHTGCPHEAGTGQAAATTGPPGGHVTHDARAAARRTLGSRGWVTGCCTIQDTMRSHQGSEGEGNDVGGGPERGADDQNDQIPSGRRAPSGGPYPC